MEQVYIQNKEGKPLMPTTRSGAVRRWLKEDRATVVQRTPFTIRLNWDCETNTQEVIVGLDTGAIHVGCSAVNGNKVLYASETKLRTDISKKMTRRAMYRRNRRNRKTRYRQARFNNRTRKTGWLPPSLESKRQSILKVVKKLSRILPIKKVIVETAKFDIQKLQNPEIKGREYQQGVQSNYDNTRAYVFERDNYTCQICKGRGGILNIHHIIQRKDGGSDKPDNLSTVHLHCHEDFHAGKIKHKFKKPKSYAPATQVTILKKYILEDLSKDFEVEETFGYITKRNRLRLGLEKTHYNDAISIVNPEKVSKSFNIINRICVEKGRYNLCKGIRGEKKLPKGKIFGFKRFDIVKIGKEIGYIHGRRSSGYFDIRKLNGDIIGKSTKYTLLKLLYHANIIQTQIKTGGNRNSSTQ